MSTTVLSAEERHFIVNGVAEDVRTDGRACHDYRSLTVDIATVTNTSGSASCKLVGTHVLVGVKAEIGEPLPATPNQGRIEFYVDCSPNASPSFEGKAGEDLSAELSNALQRTFCNDSIDYEGLCVIPRKSCWVLYVDALILECAGNLYDALSIAIKAALFDTKIPLLSVIGEGEERTIEISDDPYDVTRLDVSNVPILVTINKIGDGYVVDATSEEDACSDTQVLVAVGEDSNVCSVQKFGGGGVNPDLLFEILRVGKSCGVAINGKLNGTLEKFNK